LDNACEVLRSFYAAVAKRDLAAARAHLADDMVFEGLFETYHSADQYMTTFVGLLQITLRLDVKKIIGEANDAAIFFELETKAPAEAKVLVAEWHQVRDGKIFHARSAFDGRPYAAMFSGAGGQSG
jgi:ketosteroid isomerase-like protein